MPARLHFQSALADQHGRVSLLDHELGREAGIWKLADALAPADRAVHRLNSSQSDIPDYCRSRAAPDSEADEP